MLFSPIPKNEKTEVTCFCTKLEKKHFFQEHMNNNEVRHKEIHAKYLYKIITLRTLKFEMLDVLKRGSAVIVALPRIELYM